MSPSIFWKKFLIRKFKIRFLKSLKPGFRCQNRIFLQNKCQIHNQRWKLRLVPHSDLSNPKTIFFKTESVTCRVMWASRMTNPRQNKNTFHTIDQENGYMVGNLIDQPSQNILNKLTIPFYLFCLWSKFQYLNYRIHQ
jgi:hypothetical protein